MKKNLSDLIDSKSINSTIYFHEIYGHGNIIPNIIVGSEYNDYGLYNDYISFDFGQHIIEYDYSKVESDHLNDDYIIKTNRYLEIYESMEQNSSSKLFINKKENGCFTIIVAEEMKHNVFTLSDGDKISVNNKNLVFDIINLKNIKNEKSIFKY